MFLQCHNRIQQSSDHPLVANQSLQMAEFHSGPSMTLQRIKPLSRSAMCRLPQTVEQSNAQSQPACPSASGPEELWSKQTQARSYAVSQK